MPKRWAAFEDGDMAGGTAAAASDAATALRISMELEEDGDGESAVRCVEYAISEAHKAATGEPQLQLALDAAIEAGSDDPPALLIASVGLALLGRLRMQGSSTPGGGDADDLDGARAALEESRRIWPGNAAACCKLADLELHHGSHERAVLLYEAVSALPPCTSSSRGRQEAAWYLEYVVKARAQAVGVASYMLALLLHLTGRCAEAVPHLQRLGVRLRLSPQVWAAIAQRPTARMAPPRLLARPAAPEASRCPASVARYSNVVPPRLLSHLKSAFAPHSPFWRETGYASRGYFSFWESYQPSEAPRDAIDALARRLLPLTGCADRVVGFEWCACMHADCPTPLACMLIARHRLHAGGSTRRLRRAPWATSMAIRCTLTRRRVCCIRAGCYITLASRQSSTSRAQRSQARQWCLHAC